MKNISRTNWRLSILSMALIAALLAVSNLPWTWAMICYRCTVLPAQYAGEKDQPCSKFDGSPSFYQDCPKSTFCFKRIIHIRLSNGTMVTTFERDCAPQKYIYQDYSHDDRSWQSEEKVDTNAYTPGCFKGENRGAPNGPSEYCYCSSNYCNTSLPAYNRHENFIFLISTIMLLYLLF